MRVADRLERREAAWKELEAHVHHFEGGGFRRPLRRTGSEVIGGGRPSAFPDVVHLAALYRSACADLMLAEGHDLPRETVDYLHSLVGRAHNVVYRSQGLRFGRWAIDLMVEVPRRIRGDGFLRLAILAFWGTFAIFCVLGAGRPGFATRVLGSTSVEDVEEMYSKSIGRGGFGADALMTGFYIKNNASIGLRCYASGLALGLGSLLVLLGEGIRLGTLFGHMATTPQAANFYTFVTAHGPFELTGIVFAGAAGLRLGSGWIATRGQTRLGSLRREALASLPTAGAATVLFILAAFLEGFVSPSPLPYAAKASISAATTVLLIAYVALGGRSFRGRRPAPATPEPGRA